MITLKEYQERCLESLRDYLRLTAQTGDPGGAFGEIARRQFQEPMPCLPISVAGLGSRMPCVCFRVPTGGGTTLLPPITRPSALITSITAAVAGAQNPVILRA